ncbi:MAG: cell envelope integrity protein TolA [Betaproteobacteria bacterium]|nr:cell envelope integrity protein TolA [Betaproteobacteria bacterium]
MNQQASIKQHLEFAPPRESGAKPSLLIALAIHLLLMIALTWGISWNSKEVDHAAVEPPPPLPTPFETPKLAPRVEPKPAPAPVEKPDISIEKKKKEEAKAKEIEERKARELKEKKELQGKQELEKKQKLEKEKKQKELEKKEQQKLDQQRQENLKRIQGLAGASGSPDAPASSALKSSGPSDSYGGRIRAKIKPNIVFIEEVVGNGSAEIEVRQAPDGTIIGRKLISSSGNKAWDEAVLKAIDKTEKLPRDVDGRIHSPLIIGFKPRE